MFKLCLHSLHKSKEYKNYPVTEHIHFFGFYIGNFPDLPEEKITALCEVLNKIN